MRSTQFSDPDAKKPEDWDENQPRQVLDEAATMPDGWLVDEESMVRIISFFQNVAKIEILKF